MSNQPDELRFLCSEQVNVMYEDDSWNTRSAIANLEEISYNSALLLTDECPPLWRPIVFSVKGNDLYGVVESIDEDQTLGYFISVKLDVQSRWRKQMFSPDHLLAVRGSKGQRGIEEIGTGAKVFTLGHR